MKKLSRVQTSQPIPDPNDSSSCRKDEFSAPTYGLELSDDGTLTVKGCDLVVLTTAAWWIVAEAPKPTAPTKPAAQPKAAPKKGGR